MAGLGWMWTFQKLWKGKGQDRDELQSGEEVRIKPGFSNAQSFPCPWDCPPVCSCTCQGIKKLDAALGLPLACVDEELGGECREWETQEWIIALFFQLCLSRS